MSTCRSRPSVSTTGVIIVITLTRMALMYGLSSTTSRYASSISDVGAPVSGECSAPVM